MINEKEYQEEINKHLESHKFSEEITLARNNPNEFFRILRKSFNGKNANYETYGKRLDYKGNYVTPEYFKDLVSSLSSNPEFRYRYKNDIQKTNITDAPGFGSVRLSPPFEDNNFDKDFFEFISEIPDDNDNVIDYGGGTSPFLAFLNKGKRKLVDKNNLIDCVSQFGIDYEDADIFLNRSIDKNTVLFCFHTLEHLDNPEDLIKFFSNSDVFIFATPNEEIIETSIYHHLFMQVSVFKSIFKDNKSVAFLRKSRNGNLDIHGIVIKSPQKYNKIKDNLFFKQNFKIYNDIQ